MDYSIYILAEGKSSRMGTDKGLVKIKGTEMVLHCVENLNPLKKEIVLVTSNHEYDKFGFRTISDKVKKQGPAQGIVTALEDCKTDKCLILSCDMPLVNSLMIHQLENFMRGADIVCYEDEFMFPFPGIYSKSILPLWKEKVDQGNFKLQSLIKLFDYKTLPIDDPELFLNVNTPKDVKLVEQKLK